jgi:hypothetical protein
MVTWMDRSKLTGLGWMVVVGVVLLAVLSGWWLLTWAQELLS